MSTSISDNEVPAITGIKSFTGVAVNEASTLPITVMQSGGTTVVIEGGVTDSYTIQLNTAPTADVIITLDNTNQQITSNVTTLTFTPANWNVAQTGCSNGCE